MNLPEQPGPLAAADGTPVFEHAWQAQTIALAATLVESGHIRAADWSAELGSLIARRQINETGPDAASEYYLCALEALQQLLQSSGALPAAAIDNRTEDWRKAYLNTPHGEPVELSAGLSDRQQNK